MPPAPPPPWLEVGPTQLKFRCPHCFGTHAANRRFIGATIVAKCDDTGRLRIHLTSTT